MRALIPCLLLVVSVCSLSAQVRSPCVVSRIVDGDTFYCEDGTRVRPIGFDAPERAQGDAADSAAATLMRWVPPGDTVGLERDVSVTDRYGRRLAWVWRGDTLVNERMVASGWALLYTVPPDVRHVEALQAAQARARKEQRGIWGLKDFTCTPADYRRRRCR
jgi:micrococcal nuclease